MLAFLPGCSFVLFIFFIIFHTIIHFLWSIWLNKSTLPLSFFFWSPTPFRERVWNRLYQSYLMWISQPFLVRWSMRVRSHTIKSFSWLPSFAIFPWFPMFVGINKLFWVESLKFIFFYFRELDLNQGPLASWQML